MAKQTAGEPLPEVPDDPHPGQDGGGSPPSVSPAVLRVRAGAAAAHGGAGGQGGGK